jgi:hypothetical protein
MVKQDQALLQTKPITLHSLYDAYAGMLQVIFLKLLTTKKLPRITW